MLSVGAKDLGIRRAVYRHHGVEARRPYRRSHRHVGAIVLGHAAHPPLPWRGAPIEAGHGPMHSGCIVALQAPHVECLAALPGVRPCLLDPRRVPFGGVERLFLRGRSSRLSRRDIVDPLTPRPRRCPSRAHRSANVASVCSWRAWRTTASAA
jgi:hypothetical protein